MGVAPRGGEIKCPQRLLRLLDANAHIIAPKTPYFSPDGTNTEVEVSMHDKAPAPVSAAVNLAQIETSTGPAAVTSRRRQAAINERQLGTADRQLRSVPNRCYGTI